MRCFIACFSASKHPKSLKPPNEVPSSSGSQKHENQEVLLLKQPIEQEKIEIDISTITKSNDKQEEVLSSNNEKKETFDLKIQSQEELFSTQEITDSLSDHEVLQEESSDLFSLSIESRKQDSESEMGEKEVNSPITIQIVHSVLNPVDNLTPPLKHQEKENINIDTELNIIPFSEEPLLHSSKKLIKEAKKKPKGEEVEVETSLSSWLVGCETPPSSAKNSTNSIGNSFPNLSRRLEDRPILGELNFEELK